MRIVTQAYLEPARTLTEGFAVLRHRDCSLRIVALSSGGRDSNALVVGDGKRDLLSQARRLTL